MHRPKQQTGWVREASPTVAPNRQQICSWSSVWWNYLCGLLWFMSFCCPLTCCRSFVMMLMSAVALTHPWLLVFNIQLSHTCSWYTCKHISHPSPNFSFFLACKQMQVVYIIQKAFGYFCVGLKEPKFPWHRSHKHWKTRALLFCGVGWHSGWQRSKERGTAHTDKTKHKKNHGERK